MNKKGLLLGLALLFGASMFLVSAMPAFAAEDSMAQSACPFDRSWSRAYLPGGGFIGALVLDREGEDVGRVIDVTTNNQGTINFLIVSLCLPDMSDRLVAIPYTASDSPAKSGDVTLALTMDDLKGAPTFSRDEWPYQVHYGWAQEAYNYFEKTQYF